MIINSRPDLDALRGTAAYAEALRMILGATTSWVNDAPAGEPPQWRQVSVGETLARLDLTLPDLLAECAAAGIAPQASEPPASEVQPPPPPPPIVVSRFQARAALLAAGLLDTVDAAIAASGDRFAQEAWSHAVEFRRDSPTIAAMAATMGLTGDQIDDLFAAAAQISA